MTLGIVSEVSFDILLSHYPPPPPAVPNTARNHRALTVLFRRNVVVHSLHVVPALETAGLHAHFLMTLVLLLEGRVAPLCVEGWTWCERRVHRGGFGNAWTPAACMLLPACWPSAAYRRISSVLHAAPPSSTASSPVVASPPSVHQRVHSRSPSWLASARVVLHGLPVRRRCIIVCIRSARSVVLLVVVSVSEVCHTSIRTTELAMSAL